MPPELKRVVRLTSLADEERTRPALRYWLFGFPVTELRPELIADSRRMLQMGVPPVQIHVMSAISGIGWDEAWSDRAEGTLGSHRVEFLGRESFLRNKRAAGRLKDLADIDALEPGSEG